MGKLDGKVAIVTGGGNGIGRAICVALAAEGAVVVVSDITGDANRVATEIGRGATAVRADVSDANDVRGLVDHTVKTHGRLDILCNNAGIDGEIGPLADGSLENFSRVIAVNLRGVFLGMKYGIPAMLDNGGGSIINTASAAAHVAFEGVGPYCAAKAGVLGLTRVAAAEYSGQGIRVNAVCPGMTRTSMFLGLEQNAPELFAQSMEAAERATPSKRIAEPEEVASVVVFLAGDGASFITGSSVMADGGLTTI
jgi:NAD(P)-dependent dehydrogenase (short-subunit alcohol dehydrogenase family)